MTEEERFRCAAKACGKDLTGFGWNSFLNCFVFLGEGDPLITWNPRDDAGDSRRLEVDCVMDVSRTRRAVDVRALVGPNCVEVEASQNCKSDPHAATRLAVLNCAIEIGKAMQ